MSPESSPSEQPGGPRRSLDASGLTSVPRAHTMCRPARSGPLERGCAPPTLRTGPSLSAVDAPGTGDTMHPPPSCIPGLPSPHEPLSVLPAETRVERRHRLRAAHGWAGCSASLRHPRRAGLPRALVRHGCSAAPGPLRLRAWVDGRGPLLRPLGLPRRSAGLRRGWRSSAGLPAALLLAEALDAHPAAVLRRARVLRAQALDGGHALRGRRLALRALPPELHDAARLRAELVAVRGGAPLCRAAAARLRAGRPTLARLGMACAGGGECRGALAVLPEPSGGPARDGFLHACALVHRDAPGRARNRGVPGADRAHVEELVQALADSVCRRGSRCAGADGGALRRHRDDVEPRLGLRRAGGGLRWSARGHRVAPAPTWPALGHLPDGAALLWRLPLARARVARHRADGCATRRLGAGPARVPGAHPVRGMGDLCHGRETLPQAERLAADPRGAPAGRPVS